jgi:hypothetical protein
MSTGKIGEAKRRLPLPELMKQLGLGAHVNLHGNARCPFHDDQHPSFAITKKADGTWHWRCFAGCGKGDEIDLLAKARGLSNNEAIKEYLSIAGVATTLPKPPLERSRTPENAPEQAGANKAKPTPVQPRPLAELLGAVVETLRRYVVFPLQEQAIVIAAWVVHTWAFDAFDYTPYLNVLAASKRSGKTRVLEVLELLCRNPRLTEGASAAALMRSVDESSQPTFLLDEVDKIYSKKNDAEAENMCRFLNAGYRRGAKFLRCVGQGADRDVKEFPAFCPKAFAGIGRCLPDTVLDRSLPIEIVRQSREERAARFREREARAAVAPLRAELEALPQQPGFIETLRDARPILPEELNDRAQDISEPLVAIADLAGGEWPDKLRHAVVKLCGQEEDADIGVRLLGASKSVFDSTGADKIATENLLQALVAVEDGPWALMFEDALKHDKLQTAASKLARLLKGYKIKPRTLKLYDETTAKGYHRADFEPLWRRYLAPSCAPSEQAVTAVTAVTDEGKKVTAPVPVTPIGETAVTSISPRDKPKGYEVTVVTANPDKEQEEGLGAFLYPLSHRSASWLRYEPKLDRYVGESHHRETITYIPFPDGPKCEICGDVQPCVNEWQEPYWWLHMPSHAVRCPDCQEKEWWADGYEIDEWGMPSCWDHGHTREERIAERTQYELQETARYMAHAWGLDYDTAWNGLLAEETDEARRLVEIAEQCRARRRQRGPQ